MRRGGPHREALGRLWKIKGLRQEKPVENALQDLHRTVVGL